MLYNGDYIQESIKTFSEQFKEDYDRASYSVEIEGQFRDPPIMELCQYLEKAGDSAYQDLMIRHCILGKMITIYLDNEKAFAFTMNNLNDAWEVITGFTDHPMAYMALNNIVMSYLAKKLTLPRKKGTSEAGAAKAPTK